MAKTSSVVTAPVVVNEESSIMAELQASLARAEELKAQYEAIQKATNETRLNKMQEFRKVAESAIRSFRVLASKEEVQVLHADLFPRQKSDKPRKPRTKKDNTATA